MNLQIAAGPLLDLIGVYLWPFMRIGAFVMVMPVIGSAFVPVRVRMLLALTLTTVMAPVLQDVPPAEFLSLAGILMTMKEIAIGIAMGFLVQIVFDAITLGGQVIAMSMGLGFAVFLDHARGVNIPVLGQLFLMLGMLIFLSLDGHLAMIQLLADSFQILPIATGQLGMLAISAVLEWSGQLFVFAVKISLPAITALIVVNLSFGVMSRAAPTLNLFAVGFPVAMLLGFVVIFLNLESLQGNVTLFLEQTLTMLPTLLGS